MLIGTVVIFEDSLERLEIGWTHASLDGLTGVLGERYPEPAIGMGLPYNSVDPPDWMNTDPAPADFCGANVGATMVGLGIANYGNAVVQSTPDDIEPVSLFGGLHIAALRRSDIVPGMPEASDWLGEEFRTGYSSAIVATDPSATTDMGAPMEGAHGSEDVHVVIPDE